jgi:hypothetical protein
MMQEAIEIFAIVNFLIIGLSHIFQHQVWAEFIVMLQKQGRVGAFLNGLLTLTAGSLIVAFHNVWSGIPMVLTIVGWLYIAKSVMAFLFPDAALRSMSRVRLDNSRIIIYPGVIMVTLALALIWSLYGHGL